jgi:hypothetical protein
MPPTPKGTQIQIETSSEQEAHKHIRETYANPEAALKFFHGYQSQREKALKEFDAQLNKDEALATAFANNPVVTLRDRRLLGPLDVLNIEGLANPFLPWPLPWCRFVWKVECTWVWEWRCITIFGFRLCWPVLVLHCRWVVRLVCTW